MINNDSHPAAGERGRTFLFASAFTGTPTHMRARQPARFVFCSLAEWVTNLLAQEMHEADKRTAEQARTN